LLGGFPNPNRQRLLRRLYVNGRVKLVFLDKTQIRGFWITYWWIGVQKKQKCEPPRRDKIATLAANRA
jgi:hypothetical protein